MIDDSLVKRVELALNTEGVYLSKGDVAELHKNYASLIEQNAKLYKQSEKYKAQIKSLIHCDDINTGYEPSLSLFQREIDLSKSLLVMAKNKKCKVCEKEFAPTHSSTQKVCSPSCAIKLVDMDKQAKAKKARSGEIKRVKQKLKQLSMNDRPKALRAAQAAFNAFIRERDKHLPCISCQRHHKGQYHAGHYLSRGAHPELAFNELNNNKQCSTCNNHLSGNLLNYRVNLIKKIGLENVEWLEGPHENIKVSALELWELQKRYKQKLKELKGD